MKKHTRTKQETQNRRSCRTRPWVVKISDFRRYIYRALAALCRKPSLVIYFLGRGKRHKEWRWFKIYSVVATPDHLESATAAFRAGKTKKVVLAKLPRLRSASNKGKS